MTESYTDFKDGIKEEQSNLSKEEILDMMNNKHEYTQDLNNLPSVEHNWVERGLKVSCEGANHPYHSHFLVKR